MLTCAEDLDSLDELAEVASAKPQLEQHDVLFLYGLQGAMLAGKVNTPTVLVDHGACREHTFASDFRKKYVDPRTAQSFERNKSEIYERMKSAFEEPDIIVSDSNFLKKKLEQYFSVQSTVIPSPVDRETFGKRNSSKQYFISAQRLIPRNQVGVQIEAFKELEHELYIAGDGKQSDLVSHYANNIDNIHYLGYVKKERLARLVGEASAFIHTGILDEFPQSVRESLSAGTPVIAANSGGVPEIVSEDLGLLHENTKEDLQEKVLSFDNNEYDEEKLRNETKKYDIEEVYPKLLNVANKVI